MFLTVAYEFGLNTKPKTSVCLMTFFLRKTIVTQNLTTHSIRVSLNIQANEEFNSSERNVDEKCPQKKQAIEG